MATADETLNVARGELGNGPEKYWAWYGGSGYAWCCAFQSWVLTQVGLPTHYAWVSGLFDAMRAEGRTLAPYLAQPGDLVAFDYDGGGQSNYDHIAMVESVDLDAMTMTCIDGNWQNRVQRVRRSFTASGYAGGIAEIARPFYTAPAPTPGPTPIQTTEADMFHLKNVDGRDEYIALTESGQVVGCWSAAPNGIIGPWVELRGGIAGSNLVAEQAPDGRLCVTLAAVGELWGSWQSAPGSGPWVDWFKINDLRKFLGA